MGANILIVDDSQTLRMVIRKSLEGCPHPFNFFEAENGVDAETLVQEQELMGDPIHLITLDWVLPEQTGLDVLMRLRANQLFKTIPLVVMVTAETYEEQIAEAKKFGISAYITKPFTSELLVSTVVTALEDGGLFDEL